MRALLGPRLVRPSKACALKAGSRVEWWDVKGSTLALTILGAICLTMALLADARHHTAVLRCARHKAERSGPEDNDCVLSSKPRGIDRLWEKRTRWSFEIERAGLELVAHAPPFRRRVVTRLNSSDAALVRRTVDAMVPTGGRLRRGHLVRASVVVRDDTGHEHVVHSFDDPQRAAAALGALQAYLAAAQLTPGSLTLRYDDSAGDELVVALSVLVLVAWAWRPLAESVVLDTATEVLAVRRRNVFGVQVFDFAAALENVAAIALAEFYGDSRRPLFGIRLVFSDHTLDIDLSFGDRFGDSANLKRIVEAANALLSTRSSSSLSDLRCQHVASCTVCLFRPRDTLIFPCRHLALCSKCARQLANCPVCRDNILDRVKVYL